MPVHARVIAESATTNILTNLTLEQQMRLQQSEKRMEDMKAALHLACGVLRQTNYMDTHVSESVGQHTTVAGVAAPHWGVWLCHMFIHVWCRFHGTRPVCWLY